MLFLLESGCQKLAGLKLEFRSLSLKLMLLRILLIDFLIYLIRPLVYISGGGRIRHYLQSRNFLELSLLTVT